jgi:hypothetical protein
VSVKDQYTGDVNDYLKYALLRAFAAVHPGTLHVCWMLSASDGRSDGRRLGYLEDEHGFANLDPDVFRALGAMVRGGRRSVAAVQKTGLLGRARFHAALLDDDHEARERYFGKLWRALDARDLVFFDPDNGLEVASVACGKRNSCKYLYWQELEQALAGERTVCVYQHFPRVQRGDYIQGRLSSLQQRFPRHTTFAAASPWVAHLVCGRPKQVRRLRLAAEELSARSAGRLTVQTPHDAP